MRRERLARWLVARKRRHQRRLTNGSGGLPGRQLVLCNRRLQLFQLKLHLIKQPRLVLAPRSKEFAPHLRNRQTQMRDQSLCARRLGAHSCDLGVALAQKARQSLDLVRGRITGAHRQ